MRSHHLFLLFCTFFRSSRSSFLDLANVPQSPNSFSDPGFTPGKDIIVNLLDWRWDDVALECEQYLAPMGYAGVQISPPHEHVMVAVRANVRREPVSYVLQSRSGSESDLQNMIDRCNAVGIRIYAEVNLNHMANDPLSDVGTAYSSYDGTGQNYPAVPYNSSHFTSYLNPCFSNSGNVEDFGNLDEIRNCRYRGMNDLVQSNKYVQTQMTQYLNKLIGMGVGGFYVGDATFIWPYDLKTIYSNLNNLTTRYFSPNKRPFVYNGVVDVENNVVLSSEYDGLGRVTEVKYLIIMSDTFRGRNTFTAIGTKLVTGMLESDQAVVELNGPILEMFEDFGINATGLDPRETMLYGLASATMMAIPYGVKVVTSSYKNDDGNGPPIDAMGNILPVIFKKDGSCGNNWTCEHRWPAISHMVRFCATASGQPITAITINTAGNQMYFTRGNVAFFAINKDPSLTMFKSATTTLPPGTYCDITTGTFLKTTCTGRIVTINETGHIDISLLGGKDNMLAIHVGVAIELLSASIAMPPTSVTPAEQQTDQETTSQQPTNQQLTDQETTNQQLTEQETTNQQQTDEETTTQQQTDQQSTSQQPTNQQQTDPETTSQQSTNQQPTNATINNADYSPTTEPVTTDSMQTLSIGTSSVATSITTAITTSVKSTIIFVHDPTNMGQVLFIVGGVTNTSNCPGKCPIFITHNYYKYVANTSYGQWSINDTLLDWKGAEPAQGTFRSYAALGTPLIWTTNDQNDPSWVSWNTYGPHYWMVYLQMDCSTTDNGWFAFYAVWFDLNNADTGPSNDISFGQYMGGYHGGECGKINVFDYGSAQYTSTDFP